jgi:hypothetical protein
VENQICPVPASIICWAVALHPVEK